MSDFDKEAEREKLREQFAEDERERRNTQRMSELLLKGATMTDTHCDTCGDPIFRWDGQEFCPTCSAEGEGAATGGQQTHPRQQPADQAQHASDGDVDGAASQAQSQSPATGADPGPEPEPGSEPQAAPQPDVSPDTRTRTGAEGDPEAAAASETAGAGADGELAADTPEPAAGGDRTGTADRSTGSGATAGDLGAARGSLVRTLTRFAAEAEETANPADAREQLAAVEAAADALAALRRAER